MPELLHLALAEGVEALLDGGIGAGAFMGLGRVEEESVEGKQEVPEGFGRVEVRVDGCGGRGWEGVWCFVGRD